MKASQYLILLSVGLLLACQAVNTKALDEPVPEKGVSIYLVTSSVDLGADANALDNTQLILAKQALITYGQIEGYSANTYTFQFRKAAVDQLKELSKSVPLPGKPFAVLVDGKVVYYGLFWNPISSFAASYPYIVLDKSALSGVAEQADMQVSFRLPAPGGTARPDLRNDRQLIDRLKQDNKLK